MAGSENTTPLLACINGLPKRGSPPGAHPDGELLFAWEAFQAVATAYQCAPDGETSRYVWVLENIGERIEAYRPKTLEGVKIQLRCLLTKYIDAHCAWNTLVFDDDPDQDFYNAVDDDPHAGALWNLIRPGDSLLDRIGHAAKRRNAGAQASTLLPALGLTFADASASVLALLGVHQATAGSSTDDPPDHLVVEACDIRRAVFTTPPQTLADALAVLNLLADNGAGMTDGNRVEGQETAVTLLRDFMARQVASDAQGW